MRIVSSMDTIRIDEDLCDGCGVCVSSCVEGALELIDGKARLVREDHCDGLGACVGDCPRGAITLVERPKAEPAHAAAPAAPHACPGSRVVHRTSRPVGIPAGIGGARPADPAGDGSGDRSDLMQWPVQLHLVPPQAPYFRGTDLLLAADCAAFARADFHPRFLRGRALAIACPKLDDPSGYVEKLAAMMGEGGVRSVTVVTMEVPCCRGLERLAVLAARQAGRNVPLRRIVIGIEGDVVLDQPIE